MMIFLMRVVVYNTCVKLIVKLIVKYIFTN